MGIVFRAALALVLMPMLARASVNFYPRAGFGNQLMGYVSAAMLAERINTTVCLPQQPHEPIRCSGISGRFCSLPRCTDSNNGTRVALLRPEAWDRCDPRNRRDMLTLMCSQPPSIVAVSSCQYWGWLLDRNPHLRRGANFTQTLRASIGPSDRLGSTWNLRVNLCVHVRFSVSNDWIFAVQKWVQGADFLVHSMDARARAMLGRIGGRANSQETATGNLGHTPNSNFSDDFWSLARCANIIASHPRSTYVLAAANWGKARLWRVRGRSVVRASRRVIGDMLRPDICELDKASC